MARPTADPRLKLTPAVARAVARAVRAGVPYRFAGAHAGVSERTLFRWLKVGRSAVEDGEQWALCRELWQQCQQAQAAAVADRVKRIAKAGATNWKADAWWLERVFPADFGPDRGELAALRKEVARLAAKLGGPDAGGNAANGGQTAEPEGGPAGGNGG